MHIPDGYLDPVVAGITYIITIGYAIIAFRRAHKELASRDVSILSVLAAGIFAAQMLNWPIPGGTSLHFVGGAFAGILLGPWMGFITMFLVIVVQCLVFHDGGITALGANLLNMAIIDVLVGYWTYKFVISKWGKKPKVRFIGAFLGGWLGIFLAGVVCGFEIGISTQVPLRFLVTVPIMGIPHALLGIIEGLITGGAISFIIRTEPEKVYTEVNV